MTKSNIQPQSATRVDELLDRLIQMRSWSGDHGREYLSEIVPRVVAHDNAGRLREDEREIFDELEALLDRESWEAVALLIQKRRASLERDKQRKRQEQEAARLEADNRQREEARRAALVPEASRKLKDLLAADYLRGSAAIQSDPELKALDEAQILDIRAECVADWSRETLGLELDRGQAKAVSLVDRNVRVTARAGSGKTRTLVARASFLIEQLGAAPASVLLLAFNRKAAEEMRSRIEARARSEPPHVMTFHALAYALIHPEQELIYDDPDTNYLGLSREIQTVVDEHIRSPKMGPKIRDLMLAHYRDDWERIVGGRFELSVAEFLKHRRLLPRESLKGERVKSFGERLIANTLFENDVDYRYELSRKVDGFVYRPDFTILRRGRPNIVVEYFGMKGDRAYDEQSERKRRYWDSQEEVFWEFSGEDICRGGPEAFAEQLLTRLHRLGIQTRQRSDEEIWEEIGTRAVDSFSQAVATFVNRCRSRRIASSMLADRVERHTPVDRAEGLFIEVGASVYAGYLKRLEAEGKEDFSGLLEAAIKGTTTGRTAFSRDQGREQGDLRNLRHVLVDEFQDFSPLFYGLTEAIKHASPKVNLFCVGDDWQAINRFAGSELSYFESFSRMFARGRSAEIPTNYRSAESIVDASNALMAHDGAVAAESIRSELGSVTVHMMDRFSPSATETDLHGNCEIVPATLRVAKSFLDRGQRVVVLSRTNSVPWRFPAESNDPRGAGGLDRFLDRLRRYLPENDRGRVSISTVHKYKGLEAEAVVVLDAISGRFPLLHPTWSFLRVLDESLEKLIDDERRLFYVAMTRAMDSLALLTESDRMSPFLQPLIDEGKIREGRWSQLSPVGSPNAATLEIRVYKAFDVKDQLKDLGYSYVGDGKYWQRSVARDGFSLRELLAQDWNRGNVCVRVLSEDLNQIYPRS